MNISDLLEVAKGSARQIIESGEEHHMIMVIETPHALQVLRILLTDHNKPSFVPAMTHYLQSQNALSYVFISEGWAVKATTGAPIIRRLSSGEIHIVDLPPDDRTEILQIIAHQRGETPHLFTAPIRNTPQGRLLGDFTEFVADQISGRMVIKEW